MTTLEEAITTYYQKKATYDREYERKKETIRKEGELSEAEKREKIKKIVRKCIVCESSEGTIFSQSGRILSAICGNRANPCSLNINIERPSVKMFADVEEQLDESIKKLKDDVIRSKYNILFNFSQFDSAFVDRADEIRKKIKDYDDLKKKYTELYSKASRIEERKEKALKEEYDFLVKVVELKAILKEPDSYRSATEHYANILLPMLSNIRKEKYDSIDIVRETTDGNVLINEDKSDKGEYKRLIRERVSLNNELISVTSGMINSNEYKKAKKATATAKAKKTSTTKGTLKKKKLVVSEEAEEISP
uniref:Uncharacterized protein n=1 Tax=viral metagenome TaxID=1070528 RepID=A0A6C0BWA3_9ZZZZ